MRLMKCDQCGTTETSPIKYEDPPAWFVVTQGAEDDIHLCTIGCLATWAATQAIDEAVQP